MKIPDVVVNPDNNNEQKTTEIDEALMLCGNKKFHLKLLIISGLAFLAVACEFTMHAYILPFAECDLDITAAQMGFINAFFLGGSLVSSLFWGVAADALGRQRVLLFGLIFQGSFTVIASWATSVEMFIAFRTGTGFMCGSAATVLLSFVGEFCSNKVRPRTICILGFCWIISWWMIPGLSWLIIPIEINWDIGFIVYRSWRIFVATIGTFGVVSGLLMLTLPESPKFFLSHGKEDKALDVLSYMYSQNTGNPQEKYPIKKLVNKASADENGKLSPKGVTFISLCLKMLGQIKLIFSPPLLRNFLLSSGVYASGMFGYYSFGLWLPDLLNRFESHYEDFPDESLTMCELSQLTSNITVVEIDCAERTINPTLFINTFIMGGASLLSNLLAVILSDKVPTRWLSGAFFLSGAVSALAIYFTRSPLVNLILATVFLSAGNTGMSVHNSTAVNLFPTSVRGIGICVNFLFGRISAVAGSIIFGTLIEVNCAIPVCLVAVVYFLGTLFCLLIPKSSQKAIE